jgi:hypothetical protein
MGIMGAHYGWSPAQFWLATAHETFALIEARAEANKQR